MRETTILIDTPPKMKRAIDWLNKIPVDEVMELRLRPYKPTRSQQANRRYFKIISLIAEHTGHDKDELHEALKMKFLGRTGLELEGYLYEVPVSSAKLTTKQFAEYMEQCEAWMVTTLGIWLE